MQLASKLAAASALLAAARLASAYATAAPAKYTLHVYDHCPFCNRVEWLLQHHAIPYDRVVYGYGAGASPQSCEGQGYGTGPLALTGKKMLPVLEGAGVPCAPGARGLPESLEICAFLIGQHRLVVPCESGRADVKALSAELSALKDDLVEPRMVRMPVEDWADPRDVAYRRWKKKLPVAPPAVKPQPELLRKLNEKLAEVPALLRGADCLNSWGWGMDDVVFLPLLRSFTCVKGACFPPEVEKYMNIEATQMCDYRPHAL
ncbi:hypothetical protein AB1Y20_002711 [Prymnesium parvum]|uniref:GST N-terminal domain-containing protein n=1 Tax=Prymnesium parvum TaxID=97485 RepID=A0AB34J9U6_PRYPA